MFKLNQQRRRTLFYLSLVIALETVLCIAPVFALSGTQISSDHDSDLQNRSVGNDAAGSDLYGIGVRIGLYLQGFAFLLSAFRIETRGSIVLASSILQFSILTSLSVLIRAMSISPAETVIILQLLGFAVFPAVIAVFGVKIGGYGFGILVFVADSLWYAGLGLWFWARGYRQLPRLQTVNVGFLFVRVRLNGWFRIYSLVGSTFLATSIFGICCFVLVLWWWPSVQVWWGASSASDYDIDLDKRAKIFIPVLASGIFIFSLPTQLAATEVMIKWNGLQPNNDLSSPGQLIPLLTGICTFADGLLGIFGKNDDN